MINHLFRLRFTYWPIALFSMLLVTSCGGGGKDSSQPAQPILSAESSLAALSVTAVTIDPAFSSSVMSYTATVSNGTDSVDISATTSDSNASFTINGGAAATVGLAVGDNTVTVLVTAENGSSTRTYTIVVTRESPALASIQISSNTMLMVADGLSSPTISALFLDTNGDQMDASAISYQLLANGVQQPTGQFTTMLADDYQIKLVSGSIESNVIDVTARDQHAYVILTLPVIFHVIHFGEAIGVGTNLLSSEIDLVLEELNAAFANNKGSIDPNAVDTGVRFRFAATLPNGTPMAEPGINRVDGTTYDDGSPFVTQIDFAGDEIFGPNEAWRLGGETYWDPRQYMNVWILETYGGASVAFLPSVLDSNPLPGLRSVAADYDPWVEDFPMFELNVRGRLGNVAHEMGHRLGLLHPQEYGLCGSGDYAADTYTYLFDSPGRPACPGNLGLMESTTFMDYLGVKNTFTYDQRERIRFVLDNAIWVRELQSSTK